MEDSLQKDLSPFVFRWFGLVFLKDSGLDSQALDEIFLEADEGSDVDLSQCPENIESFENNIVAGFLD